MREERERRERGYCTEQKAATQIERKREKASGGPKSIREARNSPEFNEM